MVIVTFVTVHVMGARYRYAAFTADKQDARRMVARHVREDMGIRFTMRDILNVDMEQLMMMPGSVLPLGKVG